MRANVKEHLTQATKLLSLQITTPTRLYRQTRNNLHRAPRKLISIHPILPHQLLIPPSRTCLPRLLLSSLPVDLGPFRHASQSPRKDLPNAQRDSPLLVQPTKTQSPLQIMKEKSSRENLPSIKRAKKAAKKPRKHSSSSESSPPSSEPESSSEQVRTLRLTLIFYFSYPTIHTYYYPLDGKCPLCHNVKLERLPKSFEPLHVRLAVNFPNKISLFLTANTHVVRAGGESTA